MSAFNKFLKDNQNFDSLRDQGYNNDPQSKEFMQNFLAERTAEAAKEASEDKLFSWESVKKIQGYVAEFLAPVEIGEFAPASLGTSSAVAASNAEYLPEIGGYLRLELNQKADSNLLEMKCWLEDHEGSSPFENYSIEGVLEPIEGSELQEFLLNAPQDEPITLTIDPKETHFVIFDLYEGENPLLQNIQLALKA